MRVYYPSPGVAESQRAAVRLCAWLRGEIVSPTRLPSVPTLNPDTGAEPVDRGGPGRTRRSGPGARLGGLRVLDGQPSPGLGHAGAHHRVSVTVACQRSIQFAETGSVAAMSEASLCSVRTVGSPATGV
jgi:hypothetical protein